MKIKKILSTIETILLFPATMYLFIISLELKALEAAVMIKQARTHYNKKG